MAERGPRRPSGPPSGPRSERSRADRPDRPRSARGPRDESARPTGPETPGRPPRKPGPRPGPKPGTAEGDARSPWSGTRPAKPRAERDGQGPRDSARPRRPEGERDGASRRKGPPRDSVWGKAPRPHSGADARAAAALAVHRVRDRGQSLTRVLTQATLPRPPADRALTQELIYGTLRVLPRLEALVGFLLDHPVRPGDRDLEALVLVGLYQLTVLETPPHAAVAATVEAVRILGKPDKAALVNALLRRFLREKDDLLAQAEQLPSARWLFPEWLLGTLRRDWPAHWEAIVAASNERPPMSLRVNRLRTDRRAYAGLLAQAGIACRPIAETESGLMLDRPVPTASLPGFDEGLVSVQDGGAQLAAQILDARPGERVLDACAAPGGKTANLLERAGGDLELVAVDSEPKRLETVRETLDRLGLKARVELGDASEPRGNWLRPLYDRILLDVPCSATGVIRRHPDIKWLRRAADIAGLAELQGRILDAMWPLLAPGGRLLYATCSLLAAENQEQVAAFLARRPDARELPIAADWGLACSHGRQLLPSAGGSDGFYFALIGKDGP